MKLSGAGVLVVNGDLVVTGTVNFIGLVVVTGNIVYKGGGTGYLVRGALLAGGDLELSGTVDIEYSSQAIQVVKQTLTDKKVVTGWREVSN